MIPLLKKIQDFFIVYWDVSINNIRYFFSQRQNRIIIWLSILLFLLVIFILVMMAHPPEIIFTDEDGEHSSGEIILGNRNLGFTEGVFIDMPRIFCFKKHIVSLKKEGYRLKWQTSRKDCGLRQLNLRYDAATIERDGSIGLNFVIKGTGQPLSGELYINSLLQESITGTYMVSREDCFQMRNLTLAMPDVELEWAHNPDWCDLTGEIRYQATQAMLE